MRSPSSCPLSALPVGERDRQHSKRLLEEKEVRVTCRVVAASDVRTLRMGTPKGYPLADAL